MKNVFIVLLLAAIGVGVYFYFNKRQHVQNSNPKDLIIGKWKVDSLATAHQPDSILKGKIAGRSVDDSSMKNFEFEFRKDSLVLQTFDNKLQDTSHYEFAGDNRLLLWSKGDSSKTRWSINKLDSTVLITKDTDSMTYYFQKLR
jgi:hypothetical protein